MLTPIQFYLKINPHESSAGKPIDVNLSAHDYVLFHAHPRFQKMGKNV
jgi:hypothetical protein